jgi:two-component system, chemotaxis family, protein-glutamate methylesterase/glutaminase
VGEAPVRDVIVVGASAGGVDALKRLAAALPQDFPASVFAVLHLPAGGVSYLPQILNRVSGMEVRHPVDGESIQRGLIYVGPPDRHLMLEDGTVRLDLGPREHGLRPSVDKLFESAAAAVGSRAIAVVLSGTLDDGVLGARAVKRAGGVVIAQDPKDAEYSSMPLATVEHAHPDHIVPLDALGSLLEKIVLEGSTPMTDAPFIADVEPAADPHGDEELISEYTCPECGGSLWLRDEGGMLRFRCHVGHAYSEEGLLSEQAGALEKSLWAAVRALEERASLAGRLADRMQRRGHGRTSNRFQHQAEDAQRHAQALRTIFTEGRGWRPEPAEPAIEETREQTS